jgi:hypothetical protein
MEEIFAFKYSLGAGAGAENKDEKQGRGNNFTVVGLPPALVSSLPTFSTSTSPKSTSMPTSGSGLTTARVASIQWKLLNYPKLARPAKACFLSRTKVVFSG